MVFNLYYYVQQLSIINTMAGSSDLNLLKSWNPKLQKNKAKVSKVEEDAIEEERKIQQKQKEKELQDLASGKGKTGLEWMYEDAKHIQDKKPKPKPKLVKKESTTKGIPTLKSEKLAKDDPMSKFKVAKKRSKK